MAADQSISNADFLGLGTASSMFERNNVVIANDLAVAFKIVLTVREPVPNTNIVATMWRRPMGGVPVATTLQTTPIADGMTQECAVGLGNVALDECDEVSVQLTWATGGALSGGAAVTILLVGG